MGDTAIGWTHRPGTRGRTWNPIRGCRRKSPGCLHCYAEVQAARIVRMGKGKPTPYDGLVRVVDGEARWTGEISIDAERLAEPLRWRDPSTIFVDSMSDLFYDKRPDEHIAAVFGVAAACPQHTFLILTKYAERMRAWFEWVALHGLEVMAIEAIQWIASYAKGSAEHRHAIERKLAGRAPWPLPNVWLGVSVENQDAADERIPRLLDTPAALRFLSCEPLLGPVDLDMPRCNDSNHGSSEWGLADDEATPWCNECDEERSYGHWLHLDGGVDWVIAGAESGPLARPASDEWFTSIEEQCRAAGVPYFLKQQVVDGKLVHDFPGRQEFPR